MICLFQKMKQYISAQTEQQTSTTKTQNINRYIKRYAAVALHKNKRLKQRVSHFGTTCRIIAPLWKNTVLVFDGRLKNQSEGRWLQVVCGRGQRVCSQLKCISRFNCSIGLPLVPFLPGRPAFCPLCPASRRNPGPVTSCPVFSVTRVLGTRNVAGNGNVRYFALSQELIFWLKVGQKT